MTPSSRQISCEPIRIKDNANNGYRLVCLFEGMFKISARLWADVVFATTINSDFNDFEYNWREIQIEKGNPSFSFRIYRENDTYAKCMTSKSLIDIYLETTDSITLIQKTILPTIMSIVNCTRNYLLRMGKNLT